MQKFWIGLLVGTLLGVMLCMSRHTALEREEAQIELDSATVRLHQPEFFLEDVPTAELVFKACDYYNIQHADVVVSQAILETGNFKSDLCLDQNNLFGLYNSRRDEFFSFDHWTKSVKAYRDKIQYRYHSGDYYEWLQDIGYAEDTCYVSKLKFVKEKYNL
jgi:flagellum-specific peptidoglycan hydrolase FlgJ